MGNKRRWVELGKDALIVLLTLSAVYLLTLTPLIRDSGVLDLFAPQESPGVGSSGGGWAAAVIPTRLAVTGEGGRWGIQYDEAQMEEAFPPLGALLGDALSSAGERQAMPEAAWREKLAGPGIYFDFEGEAPLAALERWLQGEEKRSIAGSARRLLLCAGEGDQVLLCWQEAGGGAFYSCATALTQELHLNPAVEATAFNRAYFAFENQALADRLAPYTLITEEEHSGAGYDVSVPLTGDAAAQVLEVLSFSAQNHAPVSAGEVYLDGADRLVISDGGSVTFRAAQGERYPVGLTLTDGVDGALALAEAALGTRCGEARLYLMSAREEPEGICIRFGYLLEGSAVYLGGEGWAAEFWVQEGYITQFTLRFRSYAANGERTLLLPIDKAAAMLPDLTSRRQELVVRYRDAGGAGLAPGWVAV